MNKLFVVAIIVAVLAVFTQAQVRKQIGGWDVFFGAGLFCLQAAGKGDCNNTPPCQWIDTPGFCSSKYPSYRDVVCRWGQHTPSQYVNSGKTGAWSCFNAMEYGISHDMKTMFEEDDYEY